MTKSSANQRLNPIANSLVRPFFLCMLVLMITVAMVSKGIYDLGDGIMHFQFARWSWHHPELFLDHWAKPVFTLVASPFAQFGYKGIVLMNVLMHIGTAWLTWRIADRMKLPFAFLAGPLMIFAPISWGVAQSGLTEPLFALTLMLGIYFMTSARYKTAALIISFLPFVRTEGFLLAPLFALLFLIRKEYFPVALLATGTLLYSVLGALFVHHDFLWVIHNNPYRGEPLYGHGNLFHYIEQNEFIFGWAITGLLVVAILSAPLRKRFTPVHSLLEIVLVYGCFTVFFVAHSIFWWKGLFGSYGLIRVMACVLPCAVIMSLRGLQLVSLPFAKNNALVSAIAVLMVALTAFNTINHHTLLLQPTSEQLNAELVISKMAEHNPESRIVYGAHPIIPFLLRKDPFDNLQYRELGSLKTYAPAVGSMIVMDDQFAPILFPGNDSLPAYPESHYGLLIEVPDSATNNSWKVFEVQQATPDSEVTF